MSPLHHVIRWNLEYLPCTAPIPLSQNSFRLSVYFYTKMPATLMPGISSSGQSNLVIRNVYGHDRIRLLRCRLCGEEFPEHRGTALFNTKFPEHKAEEIISHLDEDCSVRATARLMTVTTETGARRLRVTRRPGGVHRPGAVVSRWHRVRRQRRRCWGRRGFLLTQGTRGLGC